jgi:hypothetical protein
MSLKKKVKLTDASFMPFGVHKGKTMANVPASYLLHLYRTYDENNDDAVLDYVKDNLSVLKQEAKREASRMNNVKNKRTPI